MGFNIEEIKRSQKISGQNIEQYVKGEIARVEAVIADDKKRFEEIMRKEEAVEAKKEERRQ